MEVKCLEIRDANTFIPVICIRAVAANDAQLYLLRRDGYRADDNERCIIMIDAQCRGVSYDPYNWPRDWCGEFVLVTNADRLQRRRRV
jgi:hypothetical protein